MTQTDKLGQGVVERTIVFTTPELMVLADLANALDKVNSDDTHITVKKAQHEADENLKEAIKNAHSLVKKISNGIPGYDATVNELFSIEKTEKEDVREIIDHS